MLLKILLILIIWLFLFVVSFLSLENNPEEHTEQPTETNDAKQTVLCRKEANATNPLPCSKRHVHGYIRESTAVRMNPPHV